MHQPDLPDHLQAWYGVSVFPLLLERVGETLTPRGARRHPLCCLPAGPAPRFPPAQTWGLHRALLASKAAGGARRRGCVSGREARRRPFLSFLRRRLHPGRSRPARGLAVPKPAGEHLPGSVSGGFEDVQASARAGFLGDGPALVRPDAAALAHVSVLACGREVAPAPAARPPGHVCTRTLSSRALGAAGGEESPAPDRGPCSAEGTGGSVMRPAAGPLGGDGSREWGWVSGRRCRW